MPNKCRDTLRFGVLTIAISSVLFVACGGSTKTSAPASSTSGTSGTVAATTTALPEDFVAIETSFVNLHKWTKVRGFYLTNMSGHLDETLKIARANTGGIYPVGTIVQLFPGEAMVKRRKGFDPRSHDWEFFVLNNSAAGTKITKRGGSKVINFAGLSCASCHSGAKPQFDFVCEETHGCVALPFKHDFFDKLQESDPRPLS